ncbi:PAS domain S-box protein [Leptospira ryugenii]|uniref:histidine kinase n=1 Tax=Leptospira ryugenii TaxID=1917863 RepID=A0A2P2E554_9LEPT|nr:PAS domain-containing sensor histidine kinase [Leptospira ryugenii]GBF52011.1 PAS domain S-box protein [Leptospira ryugenii]
MPITWSIIFLLLLVSFVFGVSISILFFFLQKSSSVFSKKIDQDIYETANSIIIRWKPDFSVISINPYAEDFFSIPSKDAIGKHILKFLFLVPEERAERLKLFLLNILNLPDQFVRQEYEVYLKDGTKKTITWSNRVFRDKNGNPIEILSIGNDITNRILAEEKLKTAAKQAKNANQSKSIFFSKITHELRTPLHAVIGFSQILEKDPGLPNHLRGYVESMYKNGLHLLSLINDLLDLSKIEAGKMTESSDLFTLGKIWENLFSLFAYQFVEKKIRFSLVQRKIDYDRIYIGDEQKILQILINLLGNALKFTNRGEVTVDIDIIPSKAKDQSSFEVIVFRVKDTGQGIAKDQLERIFEAFHQGENSSSYQKGTGLGLSISHQLVEFLGGTISVQSEVSFGSQFEFQIPLKISNQETNPIIKSPVIQRISTDHLRTDEESLQEEILLVQTFLKETEENIQKEILKSIRFQDFTRLKELLRNLPERSDAIELLNQKIAEKKFKFFISLIQSI